MNPDYPVGSLVPTTSFRTFRDSGRYESQDRLPNLDLLLDHSLKEIVRSHKARGHKPRSLDEIWAEVCHAIIKKKNAYAFEFWKRERAIKNRARFKALDKDIAEAWATLYSPPKWQSGPFRLRQKDADAYQALAEERKALKSTTSVQAEDFLQVSIAYWIEAMNARIAGDDLRVLHALIKYSLHIGMTLAPKFESESKSKTGAKQGKAARERIAAIATHILDSEVEKDVDDGPEFLLATVSSRIEMQHAADLSDYDRPRTSRDVHASIGDRLPETLARWIEERRFPELNRAHESSLERLGRAKDKPAKPAR